ncbi:RNA cytidine acetyltransferase [Centruroides vittatus]|uniref:RNA cytidine acetyltransferase n=1 Tax=Centruroides vittatus TaxID=120091 RepID=UPI00350EAC9B
MRKKIDNRIRVLIENGVNQGHRTMFVVVGDKGKDQVVILHYMLSKAVVKARPSVLWCYKKELGFSTHRKKKMRQIQKKLKNNKMELNGDDPFDLFIAATQIRFCYYSETHKILGNTYGMLILQDFEAFTPNLLARTIETIEGGGIIVILLRTLTSLKQLYTLTMDVHARFRTEAHQEVVGRFNERFILSLTSCKNCLVVDDQLNILPLSSHAANIKAVPPRATDDLSEEAKELQNLKESLQDTQPVGVLVNCCRTLDQAKALLKFIDSISEKTLRSTVALTASRGRGKSAALGLAIAGAIAFNYSNIFVTSPSPENLKTLFEFILKGFDALHYQEHLDYEIIQSTNPEFNKAVVRINVFHDHRQTVQYIHPTDAGKLGQAELLVIDEAAAIPLPLVKNLLGPYLVFMSSTINGYEGTGRSLSLKLIQQLRQQSATYGSNASETVVVGSSSSGTMPSATGRVLHEITLNESIRYHNGDDVEAWLTRLLCLDATFAQDLAGGCPLPQDCELYYINRDTLFSYHKVSEAFLQKIMALFVASHYKNSPNDLQLMSDAPAHHLFCLLPPVNPNVKQLPKVLCVIQVCLEGEISKDSVTKGLASGRKAFGDLIPWTVSQQFQDNEFPSLSGVRIVRIATHPDYQRMGYGSRAIQLLQEYYGGKMFGLDDDNLSNKDLQEICCVEDESLGLLEETVAPRKSLPPLFLKLSERRAEKLDYVGVSYGLTSDLLRFWKKQKFVPVYLSQKSNEITGEHTCIMLKTLNDEEESMTENEDWLRAFWRDFRKRFVLLLSRPKFREFAPSLALSMLQNHIDTEKIELTKEELDVHLTKYELKRLELYAQNLTDYHLIMDNLQIVCRLFFTNKLGDIHLSMVQLVILIGLGLQHKEVDDVAKELGLPGGQVMGLFNKALRRITQYLGSIYERAVETTLPNPDPVSMEPVSQSLNEELVEAAKEVQKKQQKELRTLEGNLSQYAIKGSEDEWQKALETEQKTLVSIKSIQKRPADESADSYLREKEKKKKKKFKKKG